MTFEEAKRAIEAGVKHQDQIQQLAGFRDSQCDVFMALVAEIERLQREVTFLRTGVP